MASSVFLGKMEGFVQTFLINTMVAGLLWVAPLGTGCLQPPQSIGLIYDVTLPASLSACLPGLSVGHRDLAVVPAGDPQEKGFAAHGRFLHSWMAGL